MLSQEDMKRSLLPILMEKGQRYEKFSPILARPATPGEEIKTFTGDGLETINHAKPGDYVVQNQTLAKERYLVGAEKFNQRYRLMGPAENGYSQYQPLGEAIGIEFTPDLAQKLQLPDHFEFLASWGTSMVVKANDFLVCPLDFRSVYRIARQEFFETYRPAS